MTTPPPLTRQILLDAPLTRPKEIHHVEIRRIHIEPGYAGGLHVHNGPVFGNIVEGSAVYQIEGQPESVLGPGDVFYEPEDTRIARFDAGADGVTFFAYFLLEQGQASELIPLDS
jgi:quercetin dioxygenase-like cupin family protein